jgi:hypothetical protein
LLYSVGKGVLQVFHLSPLLFFLPVMSSFHSCCVGQSCSGRLLPEYFRKVELGLVSPGRPCLSCHRHTHFLVCLRGP